MNDHVVVKNRKKFLNDDEYYFKLYPNDLCYIYGGEETYGKYIFVRITNDEKSPYAEFKCIQKTCGDGFSVPRQVKKQNLMARIFKNKSTVEMPLYEIIANMRLNEYIIIDDNFHTFKLVGDEEERKVFLCNNTDIIGKIKTAHENGVNHLNAQDTIQKVHDDFNADETKCYNINLAQVEKFIATCEKCNPTKGGRRTRRMKKRKSKRGRGHKRSTKQKSKKH